MIDVSMFLDVGLLDDKDSVPPGDFCPDVLDLCWSKTKNKASSGFPAELNFDFRTLEIVTCPRARAVFHVLCSRLS